ncbi:hypothetical protein JT317_gp70 [Klebsiella phage YMC16/01/N133_KPN_BP]|uniref:Uncharacterized protein n=1 Tax=Klebsiella phage YMC16/01/N133_KPN_BP TaxID=2026102 RepID=A0A248XDA2_9CAUD|nr:hypothetical protein JT317_gp70 [Klebsiella phage YMC16/01/N133_KPN_BP]ASW27689.1 hypothetical protein KPNN133_070 [Klebsiella phage YMC16/01/N133_KPN_BP]
MSIEKAIADQTAAIEKNTEAQEKATEVQLQVLAALQALAAAGGTTTVTSEKGAGKTRTTKNTDKSTDADPIYWHIPGTEEFGSVDTEAEWKKLKKAKAKAVKIPESKYQTLVEAASGTDDEGDTGEFSDRIQALIDEVPEEPTADDITDLFKKYLPKDLEKAERDARAEIIKPILAGVKAPKASAVKDDDRRDVMGRCWWYHYRHL